MGHYDELYDEAEQERKNRYCDFCEVIRSSCTCDDYCKNCDRPKREHRKSGKHGDFYVCPTAIFI